MRRALVLQHMNHDHPGCFLDFFAEDGIVPKPVRLFEGEDIPPLADYDFMFVLGGAQDTWQEEEHPWLRAEKAAIREWVMDRARPYFGVCLGHQLLAAALGGEVAPATHSEIGVHEVTLTEEASAHPLTAGVPRRHSVMQWHFAEVTRPPQEAQILASSPATAVQAMAVGDHAIGTQFHCEFTAQTVMGWSSLPSYLQSLERHLGAGAYDRLVRQAFPLMPAMAAVTRRLYDNLVGAAGLRRSLVRPGEVPA